MVAGLPHPSLLVTPIYPGGGIVVWILLTDEWVYKFCSDERDALIIYASEVAVGAPVFAFDEGGLRQVGAVKSDDGYTIWRSKDVRHA